MINLGNTAKVELHIDRGDKVAVHTVYHHFPPKKNSGDFLTWPVITVEAQDCANKAIIVRIRSNRESEVKVIREKTTLIGRR